MTAQRSKGQRSRRVAQIPIPRQAPRTRWLNVTSQQPLARAQAQESELHRMRNAKSRWTRAMPRAENLRALAAGEISTFKGILRQQAKSRLRAAADAGSGSPQPPSWGSWHCEIRQQTHEILGSVKGCVSTHGSTQSP